MIIGIDASNINSPGAFRHLQNVLDKVNLRNKQIKKIYIIGNKKCLDQINNCNIINKICLNYTDFNILKKFLWNIYYINAFFEKKKCDIILCLGQIFFRRKIPYVVLVQNILPFSFNEYKKYNLISQIKIFIQKILYSYTILKSSGIIFLSRNSKKIVLETLKNIPRSTIIGHGVNKKFYINKINSDYKKINIVYSSNILPYKNHLDIIKAASNLLKKAIPIKKIIFIGNYSEHFFKFLKKKIKSYKIPNSTISFAGLISDKKQKKEYRVANLVIYSSTCEAFGIGLVESMLTKRLIIASNSKNNKELLGNGGIYYKKNNSGDLANKIELFYKKKIDTNFYINNSLKNVKNFNWKISSNKTFYFLNLIFRKNK